jgi:hypothetical protein
VLERQPPVERVLELERQPLAPLLQVELVQLALPLQLELAMVSVPAALLRVLLGQHAPRRLHHVPIRQQRQNFG